MARDDADPLSADPGPIETGPVTKRTGGKGYIIGNITGANVAIGSKSKVSKELQGPLLHQALSELQKFMDLLAQYENEIVDFGEIREAAVAVQAELSSPFPRVQVVRVLLKGIGAEVAAHTTLANQLNNIQAIVAELF